MTVRVVTDSACDLSDEMCRDLGIEIVPLTIRFGDETLIDRTELSNDEFWSRCAASPTLPETAAPSTGAFQEVFERLAAEGASGIVCVNISSDLSATMQSAAVAAKAVSNDTCPIELVDTRTVSVGQGLVVLEAARLAAAGSSAADVAASVAPMIDRMQTLAALDHLENLKKGGRIGAAKAMMGSLLNFKPVISIKGEVEEAGKPRTRAKSLRFVAERVDANPSHIAVVHAQAPEDADKLIELLGDKVNRDNLLVAELGPVVGTHGGTGVVGVAWA